MNSKFLEIPHKAQGLRNKVSTKKDKKETELRNTTQLYSDKAITVKYKYK
jgi:hypothetical protein